MGVVVYQPALSKDGVSPRAEAFFKQLTRVYRVSLFDQLVFRFKDIHVNEESSRAKHTDAPELLVLRWYDLCFAAAAGNVEQVSLAL